jgi:hypothetical protein
MANDIINQEQQKAKKNECETDYFARNSSQGSVGPSPNHLTSETKTFWSLESAST